MAHFAKLEINGKVLAVHRVSDENCLNGDGVEDEEVGRLFLEKIHHWPLWKQTSFNTYFGVHKNGKTPLRGNFAGRGMSWDPDNDIFIYPQPYPSWTLNVAEARWVSPAGDEPSVTDEEHEAGTHYQWNEETKTWDKVTS